MNKKLTLSMFCLYDTGVGKQNGGNSTKKNDTVFN